MRGWTEIAALSDRRGHVLCASVMASPAHEAKKKRGAPAKRLSQPLETPAQVSNFLSEQQHTRQTNKQTLHYVEVPNFILLLAPTKINNQKDWGGNPKYKWQVRQHMSF